MNNSAKLGEFVTQWHYSPDNEKTAAEVRKQGIDFMLRFCVKLARLWGPDEVDHFRKLLKDKS